LTDLPLVVQRCRHLFDLDADPSAIALTLGADAVLGPLVSAQPGLRIPGAVDGFEIGVRAILGQQVSVAHARVLAGRLVARAGTPMVSPVGALTHYFPTAAALAAADLQGLGLTKGRLVALKALAQAVATGDLVLDRGADRASAAAQLQALPGIGPWTASYIALRALGDPDALPVHDLGLRHACERLGQPGDARSIAAAAEAWRPWRGYAAFLLWNSLAEPAAMPAAAPAVDCAESTPAASSMLAFPRRGGRSGTEQKPSSQVR
jgi:AraC family transcriptional regulator of adaptative response / DNA-3-methyladenine glycosylase II